MLLQRCSQSSGLVLRPRLTHYVRFSSSTSDALHGSVAPHLRHLVLFTGREYASFPSHIDSVSPVARAIARRITNSKSPLAHYALAMTDSSHPATKPSTIPWDPTTPRFGVTPPNSEHEEYGAIVYPDRREVPFGITVDTVQDGTLDDFLSSLPHASIKDQAGLADLHQSTVAHRSLSDLDVFVCTHNQRDCRCGEVGAHFYESLASEAKRRRLGHAASRYNEGKGPIRIHRTTHIGGHKYAATCFTSAGDWYGLLSTTDAPNLLEYLEKRRKGQKLADSVWWEKWRGCTGLSKEAQEDLASAALQDKPGVLSALDMARDPKGLRLKRTKPLGDRVLLPVKTYEGETKFVSGFMGETLMEALKRQEMVEATCGGACECATCHIHIRQGRAGSTAPVPEVTDEEDDQLEYALFADDDSRLACRIVLTPEFTTWLKAGGSIELPRY